MWMPPVQKYPIGKMKLQHQPGAAILCLQHSLPVLQVIWGLVAWDRQGRTG